MYKKLILILLLAGLAAGTVFLLKGASGHDYLLLTNGKVVEIDVAWQDKGAVLYEKNGKVHFLDKKAVRKKLIGSAENLEDVFLKGYCYIKRARIPALMDRTWVRFSAWGQGRFGGFYIRNLVLCGGGIVLMGLVFFRVKRRYPKKQTVGTVSNVVKVQTKKKRGQPVGISDLEKYFLNIYKAQLGAPFRAPTRLERDKRQGTGPEIIYKIFVQHNREWKFRGMSIAPLGDDMAGRSQCFYVIFDTHMVIKVPAQPIKDFSEYIQRIRYERRIVEKLSPRECVIPNVSIIIHKIKPLSGVSGLAEDALEKKYVTWIETNPEYQDYLKIGGGFAFFMNLSRHFFLEHVMRDLHKVADKTRDVIASDAGLILDCHGFESKYGPQNGWVCFELQKLFHRFDMGLNTLKDHVSPIIHADQREKTAWFFDLLAGNGNMPASPGPEDRARTEAVRLFKEITGQALDTIRAYHTLAEGYARSLLFNRNRTKIEGIINNLLVLLDWMGQKNVAMRDLKPDNLFVAGNPENYPQFLSYQESYTIGLIDLETAVDYSLLKNGLANQPSLGGTPAYATPSHFFPNSVFDQLYADLPLIMHLQDWYALVGIMYEISVGRRLFRQTANQISKMVMHLNKCLGEQDAVVRNTYQVQSRMFWRSALSEFKINLRESEKWLQSLSIVFPENMRTRSREILDRVDHRSKQVTALIHRLGDPDATWTVKDLMEIMFHVVFYSMYPEAWEPVGTREASEEEGLRETAAVDQNGRPTVTTGQKDTVITD